MNLSDQSISSGQGRIDSSSYANQATRNGELQIVLFGVQGRNLGVNGGAHHDRGPTSSIIFVVVFLIFYAILST